jgi:hypothetical protein
MARSTGASSKPVGAGTAGAMVVAWLLARTNDIRNAGPLVIDITEQKMSKICEISVGA